MRKVLEGIRVESEFGVCYIVAVRGMGLISMSMKEGSVSR